MAVALARVAVGGRVWTWRNRCRRLRPDGGRRSGRPSSWTPMRQPARQTRAGVPRQVGDALAETIHPTPKASPLGACTARRARWSGLPDRRPQPSTAPAPSGRRPSTATGSSRRPSAIGSTRAATASGFIWHRPDGRQGRGPTPGSHPVRHDCDVRGWTSPRARRSAAPTLRPHCSIRSGQGSYDRRHANFARQLTAY